jgi:hypothetical protein
VALFRRSKHTADAKGMRAFAASLGLEYEDAPDLDAIAASGTLPDVPLLRDLDHADISQLIAGELDGLGVRLFRYAPTSYDAQGSGPRTCLLFNFEATVLPGLFISPRTRLARLGEQLQEGGIAVGSPELMRKYSIQARSREYALDIVGVQLEQWLLGCQLPDLRIEMHGQSILGHIPEAQTLDEITELLDFLRGFHQRIPERAWHLYRKL